MELGLNQRLVCCLIKTSGQSGNQEKLKKKKKKKKKRESPFI
jgi:hypothetical protein